MTTILYITTVQGQYIIDTNRTWNVLERDAAAQTKCYKFDKDTMVEGRRYKELRYSLSEWYKPEASSFAGLIRESEGQVYIRYRTNEEFLLYDFTLEQNDTVNLGFLNGETNLLLVCDTISVMEIDSIERKVLHMQPLDQTVTVPQLWVEGMGSTHGIVDVGRTQVFGNESALLCFKDIQKDSILWQSTLGFCYFSNARKMNTIVFQERESRRKEKSKEQGPSNQVSKTEWKVNSNLGNSGMKLKIYDDAGNLVESRLIRKEKDLTFDKLESGFYMIQLTDSFDKIYAVRRIKI